jgi:RNA-directed DNA polymerase
VRRTGGAAPGIDGITYACLSRSESAEALRVLSRGLLDGTYRPHPARRVPLPKPGGGHRTLALRNIFDRVVARALADALTPLWERVFLPRSFGFRPGLGVWHLLAALEADAVARHRWVLATDDIKKAFDNVIIDDVLADHRSLLQESSLLPLTDVVLRGGEAERKVGIDQGSPVSPLALNVRLHHAHDLGVNQGHLPSWYRYADNVAYLCEDVSEGEQALERARNLLEGSGLSLKGEDGRPTDLREESTQLLGFSLKAEGGRLRMAPGKGCLDRLTQSLEKAYETNDPTRTANQAVHGWVEAMGPAFEGRRSMDVLREVYRRASNLGFREIDPPKALRRSWRASHQRWLDFTRTLKVHNA